MRIDFSAGWRQLSNPIVVDLLVRTDGVYAAPQSVPYVQKNREEKADTVSGQPVTMDATSTVFHLWVTHLGGSVPDKGSKIVEPDGTTWHVTGMQLMGHKTRYRCECRKDRSP